MTDVAVVKAQPAQSMALAELKERAALFVGSRLAPEGMTADQAAIIAMKGRELGLGMMQSLEEIYVVRGRPAMSAKLMAALYTQAGHKYDIKTRTDKQATVLFTLRDGRAYEHTITIEDATKAGWTKNAKYQEMPAQMLTYRALASGIRIIAPEVLHGMIVREEAEDASGEIVEGTVTVIDGPADWSSAAVRDELIRTQAECRLDDHDAIAGLSKAAGKPLTRRGEWTGTLLEAQRALRAYAAERDGAIPTQAEQKEMF